MPVTRVLIIGADPAGTNRGTVKSDIAVIDSFPDVLKDSGFESDNVLVMPDGSTTPNLTGLLEKDDQFYNYAVFGLGLRTLPAFLGSFSTTLNLVVNRSPRTQLLFPPTFENLAYETIDLIKASEAQSGFAVASDFCPVRTPGSQSSFGIFTDTMERVVAGSETESQLCFNRSKMHIGQAPPLHVHTREDEFWIILKGTMRYWYGATTPDECIIQDAPEGSVVVLPRNVPHSFSAVTEEVEFLSAFCPGKLQSIFRQIGSTETRDDTAHTGLFNRYGVSFVGPSPASGTE